MKDNQSNKQIDTTALHIRGLVQGVGFRPFVYKVATGLKLTGTVYNKNTGVIVHLQGDAATIEFFKNKLLKDAPVAAEIMNIKESNIRNIKYNSFTIGKSTSTDDEITLVCPDIAVCDACRDDMQHQKHRIDYSFTNCTNCGPRFSITEDIPYDRVNTSMKIFEMCPLCFKEYNQVSDRRFHAQPVACNNCGPSYSLHSNNKTYTNTLQILEKLKESLETGNVAAIKGLGGYHLACDPFNGMALQKLRKIKARDGKPFALMFRDLETCMKYAMLSTEEIKSLTSWQRPIVIAEASNPEHFAYEITNGLKTIGAFLPYLPFHYQLFEKTGYKVLVMTSANKADCPIIIDDNEALTTFLPENIAVVTHNRNIINRVDDSILQKDALGMKLIRRARGFTPKPLFLKSSAEGIFAAGAELTSCFCLGKADQAIMSQHIGDIKNLETMQFYEQSFETMKRLFKFTPYLVCCDMHPDYLSTKFAESMQLPMIKVQHHHAHIAACMAEYGIDEPVIGICYDGTGYGTDGKIWGSEIMVADLKGFERKYHFEYIPIPGGDKAIKEPWRSAYSYLFKTYNQELSNYTKHFNQVSPKELELVQIALAKQINSPDSCSAGRLFDAVAALLAICVYTSYHAEAALKLENSISAGINTSYSINLQPEISWADALKQLMSDIESGIDKRIIAAKFHNTVAEITFKAIGQISLETGIQKVVLTGGTFQNVYLTKKIVDLISNNGLMVFMPRQLPCNDGGIALGQLAIAAKKLNQCV